MLPGRTADWCHGRRLGRQRGVDHHIVNLLLVLRLRQRIVQIALHFNTLLAFRSCRCLTLGWCGRDWRQRDILLGVPGSLLSGSGTRRRLGAIGLIGSIAGQINTLLSRGALIRWIA